ncbi:UDP-N-acetylmuramyl-tripeptide synthetase [Arenibacter aquaticus]|uniref:UDP-N-acetylmuramyl-tripeptide synthetase n=1 Tax=Arenibacter aquaticus TaxID=2489054 RepID=A0A430K6V3_9FLAO|nr:UDP-N-acetylmuramyl-tripeptide synthetase [Arenibacter aquaticus]RTE54781.1 UDP-N-acetylmuramyl-tripeptide synthetase [Arenibacter aquaticus]
MKIIAITGTNGKTTTLHLAHQLLQSCGYHVASLGTLGLQINEEMNKEPVLLGSNPMGSIIEEIQYFYDVDFFLFEAYSAGLKTNIYKDLEVNIALLTNITKDHIDVHENYSKYKSAKCSLFHNSLKRNGLAIYRADDPIAGRIDTICKVNGNPTSTFGFHSQSTLQLLNYTSSENHTNVKLKFHGKTFYTNLPFVAKPNIYNWLGAFLLCSSLGISKNQLLSHSNSLLLPEGRFEIVTQFKGAKVIVDFANNPAALEEILKWANENHNAAIHLVFGASGGIKQYQRKKMATIANTYADRVYITDDNPREEIPDHIRMELKQYCKSGVIIPDRRLAIQNAMDQLQKNDVLLIVGKGHETYQETNELRIPFNDKDVIIKYANSFTTALA